MDLQAIATAIAGRFTGVTANGKGFTSPPTALLPNTIAKGPVCLVYPPSGSLEIGLGRRRNDHYDFPVKILIDPLDVPTRSGLLYAWFNATRDRVEGQISLGIPETKAQCVAVRMAIDGEAYGGSLFDVIEYTIRVLVYDVVATVGYS